VNGIFIHFWWNIWKERNRRQFQQKALNPRQVTTLCKDDIMQYRLIMAPRTEAAKFKMLILIKFKFRFRSLCSFNRSCFQSQHSMHVSKDLMWRKIKKFCKIFWKLNKASEVAVSLCSAGPKIYSKAFTVLSLKKGTSQWDPMATRKGRACVVRTQKSYHDGTEITERVFMTTTSASALRDCNCYGLV